jgi:hypothetical protein
VAVAPETPYNSSLQLLLLLRVIIKKKTFHEYINMHDNLSKM